ncbi:MAG: GIY-YIG nuclease family protein [Patescibacteria group bacterium]
MAQVITVVLLDGTPKGLQIITVDNWNGQAFVIPRGKLNEIHEYDEMSRPGIYFLFGDGVEKEKVYIGQTNNLASRLSQHDTDRESEAWNKAICFAGHLDAGLPQYLESQAIGKARGAGRYEVLNVTHPIPILTSQQRITADTYLIKLETVLLLFGYKVFDEIPTQDNVSDEYSFSQGGARGSGSLLDTGEFVVFKGSTARKQTTDAYPASSNRLRQELLERKILIEKSDALLEFSEDHVFSSPSGASNMIAGVATNGWDGWKDSNGRTLDENVRKEK